MAKCKLTSLKKKVKSHLKEDMHDYKKGIADDKALIKKMKSKEFSLPIDKSPHSTMMHTAMKMRRSSRSK